MFRRGRHGDYGEKGDISLLFSRGRLGDYGGGGGGHSLDVQEKGRGECRMTSDA